MIRAAEEAGTRVPVEYGSLWLRMDGGDAASALLHATIAVPGATNASTGLPEDRTLGGVWIMMRLSNFAFQIGQNISNYIFEVGGFELGAFGGNP